MHKELNKKVPGGKLIKLKIDYEDTITNIKIEGDFFLHPEKGRDLLEHSLIGTSKLATDNEILGRLNSIVIGNKLELVGFEVEDILNMVKEALNND